MSLTGYVIAMAGPHSSSELQDTTLDDIKRRIINCGGSYTGRRGASITHLVATAKQYQSKGAKVQEALKDPNIKIVDFDWLVKSLDSKTMIADADFVHGLRPEAGHPVNGVASALPQGASATSTLRKRGRDESQNDTVPLQGDSGASVKKQKHDDQDGRPVKCKSLNIPLDEECTLIKSHNVHIDDDDGTIFDVTMNQTNSGNNNNKFYRIQLLVDSSDDYRTWTRWGRVGEIGQHAMLGSGTFGDALAHFRKKFKDKTGHSWDDRMERPKPGKYTFIERNYEDNDDENDDESSGAAKGVGSKDSVKNEENTVSIESKLPGPIQNLMKLIFNQEYFDQTLASLDYDANKMPLGKLSKRTLKAGYEILKDIAAIIGDRSLAQSQYGSTFAQVIENLSNSYLSTIPHDFGRRRPPILRHLNLIKKEIDLLENLTDMQLANEIMKSAKGTTETESEATNIIDRQYKGLGMREMAPLDMKSAEFEALEDYLKKSAGPNHSMCYKVHDIFRIEREGENDRFRQSPYALIKNSDRRLLWHGSRCTNFGGILSQGLRIAPPEAPVSGYMFGKGVYLADMSSKSAGYCAAAMSGNIGLLLLCEAELGNPPLKLTDADHNAGYRAKEEQCLSTWGIGRTAPAGWKDASYLNPNLRGVIIPDTSREPCSSDETNAKLLYNEYIVYDVAQIRLRYLLRVEIGHGFVD